MYIHKYFWNILKDINYVQIKYVFMYLNNLQFLRSQQLLGNWF